MGLKGLWKHADGNVKDPLIDPHELATVAHAEHPVGGYGLVDWVAFKLTLRPVGEWLVVKAAAQHHAESQKAGDFPLL
jgi:hypothetical protein